MPFNKLLEGIVWVLYHLGLKEFILIMVFCLIIGYGEQIEEGAARNVSGE